MKTKKIVFLGVVLLVMISGGIFIEIEKAEACKCMVGGACLAGGGCEWTDVGVGTTCSDIKGFIDGVDRDSDHACYMGKSKFFNISVCMIDNLGTGRCCMEDKASCCTSTISTYKYCRQDKCGTYYEGDKIDDPSTNGKSCRVTTKGKDTCGHYPTIDGRWDYKENKCVLCGGDSMDNTEVGVYGDSGTTYVIGPAPYSMNADGLAAADNEFESACGADESCDEKSQGDACTGGHCDKNGKCCLSPKIVDASGDCVAAATCNTDPTVEIDPPSQSASKGTELSYTIKVTNNDDASCATASRTFNLSNPSKPAGWTATDLTGTSVTVNKNSSDESTTYKLQSLAGSSAGLYNFTITAADSDGSHSAEGYYYVTDCPPGITPDTDTFKFEKSIYVASDLASNSDRKIKLKFKNTLTSRGTTYAFIEAGTNKCTKNDIPWDSWVDCSYMLSSGDRTDILWMGKVGSVDCKVTTKVVECTKDSHCAGTDVCVNNKCKAAASPSPPPSPVPPCDSLDCGAAVTNANCMCGLQLVSVNGDYCCAADNYYGDNATCITKCGAVPPSPAPPAPPPSGPASPCGLGTGMFCNPVGWDSIPDIAEGMLNYLLGLVGSIALLFLIIAGVMYMTAGGSEEKITTAKRILTGAIIGLGIVLLAYSLLAEINKILSP